MKSQKENWAGESNYHPDATNYFNQALAGKVLHHAYLLHGRSGLGKFAFASALAKKIICSDMASESEKRCLAAVDNLSHPEFWLVKSETENQAISVEEIKAMRERLLRSSLGGSVYKVAVVDQAHNLTQAAANAILKILEEPPKNTIIILVSSLPEKILPTIKSRTQLVKFNRAARGGIEKNIKSRAGDKAGIIASLAAGRPKVAEGLLDNKESLDELLALRKRLLGLLEKEPGQRLIDKMAAGKREPAELQSETEDLVYVLHDQLISAAGLSSKYLVNPFVGQISAKPTSLSNLRRAGQDYLHFNELLKTNANRDLVYENIFLNL